MKKKITKRRVPARSPAFAKPTAGRRPPLLRKKKPAARRPKVETPSPALLAAALRAQSEGVFLAGCAFKPRGLTIIYVNESFCNITGRTAKDLIGRTHGSLHLEKSDLPRLRNWLGTARPGEALSGEGYLVRADGSTVYAAWTFDPLYDTRGRLTHVVGTYRDTTEKRRLQEALVHSQRLDAVGRLAGGVAHDFNNLISVINGYSQILAVQLGQQPQALREVEEIHKAGQKAAGLTRQLLAFSRRQPMNPRVFNLNTVIRENGEILERLLGDAGKFRTELDLTLGNVRADPSQFQQVLLNLVINARDALRANGEVTIRTVNREVGVGLNNRRLTDTPPGAYVELTVKDNGTGMDASVLAHLFEPFFTTKEEGKGTGLGLALVYGVIQQSGGYITVQSAPGMGSSFEILLPVVREPAAPAPATSLPTLTSVRGDECILFVEDDPVVSKMVAGILTSDGYKVITARNAAEALKEVRRHNEPVQLLIAAFGAPGSESEKLARALHVISSTLRILNTGTADFVHLAWLPTEHQASLPKPFALSDLVKSARTLLDSK